MRDGAGGPAAWCTSSTRIRTSLTGRRRTRRTLATAPRRRGGAGQTAARRGGGAGQPGGGARRLQHAAAVAGAPVRDVWRVAELRSAPRGRTEDDDDGDDGDDAVPSAAFNLAVNGATSDGAYNTWCWTRSARKRLRAGLPSPVDPDAPDAPDGRGGRAWVVKAAAVALTERHPALHVSLSDHFAVQATLVLHSPSSPGCPHAYDAQLAADQTPATTHLRLADYNPAPRHHPLLRRARVPPTSLAHPALPRRPRRPPPPRPPPLRPRRLPACPRRQPRPRRRPR